MDWPLDERKVLHNIRKNEGKTFQTVEGHPFSYIVNADRLVINGRNRAWVQFADLREILRMQERPKSVRDVKWGLGREVWGSSYLYALLNDERIIEGAVMPSALAAKMGLERKRGGSYSPVSSRRHNPGSGARFDSEEFENFAREVLERKWGVSLQSGSPQSAYKEFDFLSEDGQIVGDAKYYKMPPSEKPSGKFATITEYVWLLEKTPAQRRFLVFGNDRRVPEQWLKRYGRLVDDVEFYFLDDDGNLELLN